MIRTQVRILSVFRGVLCTACTAVLSFALFKTERTVDGILIRLDGGGGLRVEVQQLVKVTAGDDGQ